MPMTRFALVLAVGWLAAGPALADPPRVNRAVVTALPCQQRIPMYGQFVFGPKRKDRVWLVLDGDAHELDRNGNGDLTGPGEKIAAQTQPDRDPEKRGHTFEVGDLTL